MDWSDEGTQEFRDSLTDAELDEWRDWQEREGEKADQRESEELARALREEPDWDSVPDPTPSAYLTDLAGNRVTNVTGDQPLVLVLEVPVDENDKLRPGSREVTVTSAWDTETFTIPYAATEGGVATYRSNPFTLSGGGEGAGSVTFLGFEFSLGDFDGVLVGEGAPVSFSVDGAQTTVRAFESDLQMGLSLYQEAFEEYQQYLINVTANVTLTEAMLPTVQDASQRDQAAQGLASLRADTTQRLDIVGRALDAISDERRLPIQQLAVAAEYGLLLGLDQPLGSQPMLGDWDVREEWRRVGVASDRAGDEASDIVLRGLGEATIGGYQLLVSHTGAGSLLTAVTGTNEMGTRVQGWERGSAVIDLVVEAASTGAGIKWNLDTTLAAPRGDTAVVRRIPREKRLPADADATRAPVGTVIEPNRVGMLDAAAIQVQLVARKHNVIIEVRPTGLESVELRKRGGQPKPPEIKSKTAKAIDYELGLPRDAELGAATMFEPKLPNRSGHTDAEWAQIEKRFKVRNEEWHGPIGEKQRKLLDDPEAGWERHNGNLYKDGNIVCGDYDLFDIRTRTGEQVSAKVHDEVIADLAAGSFRAQHGPHMFWDPQPGQYKNLEVYKAERNIFDTIVDNHRSNIDGSVQTGEIVVRVMPEGPLRAAYSDTEVGPHFAEITRGEVVSDVVPTNPILRHSPRTPVPTDSLFVLGASSTSLESTGFELLPSDDSTANEIVNAWPDTPSSGATGTSAGDEVLVQVADAVVLDLIHHDGILMAAADAGVSYSSEVVASTVASDPGAAATAVWLAESLGLRTLFVPHPLREPDAMIDPPAIDLPPEHPADTVIMDEMEQGSPMAGQGGQGDADTWARIADEKLAERAAGIPRQVDDLVSSAIVTALRGADVTHLSASATAGFRGEHTRHPNIILPQATRLVDVIATTATERINSGVFEADPSTGNLRPQSSGPQWVEDSLRNPDREHPRFRSSRPPTDFNLLGAIVMLFDRREEPGVVWLDPTVEEDQWGGATAIMDEMEPGSALAGQGGDGDADTWEQFADERIEARHERMQAESPFWRQPSVLPFLALFGIAGLLAIIIWFGGGWGEGSDDAIESPAAASSPQPAEDDLLPSPPASEADVLNEPPAATTATAAVPTSTPTASPEDDTSEEIVTAPVPTTATTTTTTTTTAPSAATTVSATITVTHADQDASGASRPESDTVCEISAVLDGQQDAFEAEMTITCSGDPVGRLGLLTIVHGGGQPAFPIDGTAEGPQTLALAGSAQVSGGDDVNAFLHWEMLFGPIDMLSEVASTNPDVRCTLRNGPMGSAGTHAADCFFGEPPN
jgi:hypothetical protein